MAKSEHNGPKAWLVSAFGDKRQYSGNAGYKDEISSAYAYDSNVGNSRQVGKGDILLLRGPRAIVGVARVLEITDELGDKEIYLCPKCSRTGAKERTRRLPKFRCPHCRFEFEQPIVRLDEVTEFVARYDGAFLPLQVPYDAARLLPGCPTIKTQLSIKEVNLRELGKYGDPLRAAAQKLWKLGDVDLAVQPTADTQELARRVRELRKRGRIKRPAGRAKPKRKLVATKEKRERDPEVVLWALQEAGGICGACRNPGPFPTSFGDMFLEVHHVVPLAEDGPDTPDNAVAVCPNCHRALHHALDKMERRSALMNLGSEKEQGAR